MHSEANRAVKYLGRHLWEKTHRFLTEAFVVETFVTLTIKFPFTCVLCVSQDGATDTSKEYIKFKEILSQVVQIFRSRKRKRFGFSVLTFGLTPQRGTTFAKCGFFLNHF